MHPADKQKIAAAYAKPPGFFARAKQGRADILTKAFENTNREIHVFRA